MTEQLAVKSKDVESVAPRVNEEISALKTIVEELEK